MKNNMKLSDLFPKMNKNQSNGIFAKNGICMDIDTQTHLSYLGILDNVKTTNDMSFYFPSDIVEIDEDTNYFNTPGQEYNNLVITTNMKRISPYIFMCMGFKNVYIIDSDTEEVVFHSEKFRCGIFEFLANDDLWIWFCDDYGKDPIATINDPIYYDPNVDLE